MPEAANPVAHFLANILTIPLTAVLLVNLLQRRRQGQSEAGRRGTLALAGLVLALLCACLLLVRFQLPDILLLPVLAVLALTAFRFRSVIFPFPLRCSRCGRLRSLKRILFHDEPLCAACRSRETREPGSSPDSPGRGNPYQ